MIYLKLFWSFFQVGLFSIGGGYSALPLIEEQAIEVHHWLTYAECLDYITIAEMAPGSLTLNVATFIGNHVAGILGAIVAIIGSVLPACFIVSLFVIIYLKFKKVDIVKGVLSGLRAAVVAIIASAGITIIAHVLWGEAGIRAGFFTVDIIALVLFLIALYVIMRFKWSPLAVILSCGAVGGIAYMVRDVLFV